MEPNMNFTQGEIAALIGTKELELVALRRELTKALALLAEQANDIKE